MADYSNRHQGVQDLMRFFVWGHLRADLQDVSSECERLAHVVLEDVTEDSAELTTGLRKLLEAKDCFVRAKLSMREEY